MPYNGGLLSHNLSPIDLGFSNCAFRFLNINNLILCLKQGLKLIGQNSMITLINIVNGSKFKKIPILI